MSGSLRSISSSLPPTDWGVPQVSVPWLGVRSSAGRTAPTGHTFSSGEHPPAFPRGRGFSQGYFRTRRLSSESSRASAEPVSNMSRSSRLSSSSLPPLEDDADSVCSDELLGSQSRLWLTDILSRGPPEDLEVNSVGRDGLFVDRNFPVGSWRCRPGSSGNGRR
ncbi:hypothetical protein Q5P01_009583 [Channa striata]|uniref:Uncharacterized protein n=1 Tax=Channa striata TaxID=64152 RepID=A0AA88MWJ4_CHASR|nr:hypothetical protein Q5P01_009583 [Channa striata]